LLRKNKMSEQQEKVRQVVTRAKQRAGEKVQDLWWWLIVRGVLALGLAVVALFWPEQTVRLLVNLLGGYLLLDGLLGIVGAYRSADKGSAPLAAIIGLLIGAVLLFWTGLSLRIFLILVGAWASIQGVGLFIASRSPESDPEARRLVGVLGGALALAGVVLIAWPQSGVVTVSWLIALVALVLGSLLLWVGSRLRRIAGRLQHAE
jgi:uncharacterized membrane protein HdeD (DUF308 family)